MRLQPIFNIAEQCAQLGIRQVVISPGSRSAPLTLAFVRHGKFETRVFPDERSAAYVALGMARSTSRPVVLICTSGTAALNFAPAIAEAYFQNVPLLVFTADRPAEWIAQQDGQAIHQQGIYGPHVKKSFHLPADYSHADSIWMIHRCVNEAVSLSQEYPYGPVHINVPLREPLYPTSKEIISFSNNVLATEYLPADYSLAPEQITKLQSQLLKFNKILVVAGQQPKSTILESALHNFIAQSKNVLLGDILSNQHGQASNIRLADSFLPFLGEARRKELQPDLLISFGNSIISKQVKLYLRQFPATEHWHIQPAGAVADPYQSVSRVIRCTPSSFFTSLKASSSSDYQQHWGHLDAQAKKGIAEFLRAGQPNEIQLVAHALSKLAQSSQLHLANSMTVRYANYIGLGTHQQDIEVFANRGTSGIDGCTSSSIGHALTSDKPQVLLTGDMAFLYDRNAFWHNYSYSNFKALVLNNHGGIIFNMIDGPGDLIESKEYFVTQQRQRAAAVANEYGIYYSKLTPEQFSTQTIDDFLRHPQAAVLEFESTQELNKSVFEQFKLQIKKSL